MSDTSPITKEVLKKDLEHLYVRMEKMVGSVVGEIVGEALQLISERFDRQDKEISNIKGDVSSLKAAVIRIENKLDTHKELIDSQTFDIRELQRKTA